MHSQFLKRMADLGLIAGKHRILVAISGGPDSVALTDLISHAGFQFGMAHCDFGLRGKESTDDAVFCKELSQFYQVPFHSQQFNMNSECETRQTNIQESARQIRYEYFDLLRREHQYDYIVTGHHSDDSAETFFINLLRGSGLKGLKGIPAINGYVVRPLLNFTRKEIEKYIQDAGLQFRLDSSNASFKYDRNVIRHRLFPILIELNPIAAETIRQTQYHLEQTAEALNDYLETLATAICSKVSDGISIDKKGIYNCKHGQLLMFHLLHPYGFTPAQCNSAYKLCAPDALPGKKLESAANTLFANRDTLRISSSVLISGEHVVIQSEADFEKCKKLTLINEQGVVALDQHYLTLDRQTIIYPLVWRNWEQGDRIQPFGMKGTKLVSDLLREHRLSEPEKHQVQVLVNNNDQLLWVAGIRASEITRIAGGTSNTFILRYASSE